MVKDEAPGSPECVGCGEIMRMLNVLVSAGIYGSHDVTAQSVPNTPRRPTGGQTPHGVFVSI